MPLQVHRFIPLIALIVAVACSGGTSKGISGATALGFPECPHDWPTGREKDGLPGWLNNVAGPVKDIPEFHDCQKFIVERNKQLEYTELFAIFARFRLDSLLFDLDTTLQATMTGSRAVTAAEIYAEGTYPPLDIWERFSCVILYFPHGEWRAKVVPKSAMGDACQPLVNPADFPMARELVVRRTVVDEDFPDAAYPPVARWDWDSVNLEQYMGFKCGRAWCEVGDVDFAQSKSYVMPTAWAPPERWVRMVKGWYDEQILGDTAGATRPIGVLGSIFPDPRLDRLNTRGDFSDGWKDIAHVVLHSPSPEYSKKRRFEVGTPLAPKSVIRFCFGTEAECGVRGPTPTMACGNEAAWDEATVLPGDHQRMHVALFGGTPTPTPTCAHRRVPKNFPTGYQIPATVRWRWTTSDETAWGRCGTGCCVPH